MSLDQLKSHPLIVNVHKFILACLRLNHDSYEPIPSNLASSSSVIGVVRVVLQAANVKKRVIRPRPFVTMRVQGRAETRSTVGQTKTCSPNWLMESSHLLIYSLNETLEFRVLNRHRFLRSGTIGKTSVPLTLLENATSSCTGKEENIFKGGHKLRGTLLFDLFYYPISLQRNVAYSSINVGVITLRVVQAKGLTWDEYERKPSTLIALTSLGWTSSPIHQSEKAHRFDNPSWNCVFDFLCFDKARTTVVVKIVPKVQRSTVQVVYGHVSLALNDLVEARNEERDWWPLSGFSDGQIQVTAEWKPIDMNV